MSEIGIKNQIYQYEKKISEKRKLIQEQEEKIYDLQMLRTKILALQEDFIEKQNSRKHALENMIGNSSNNKIARLYKSGMKNLLGGSQYRAALSNFESSYRQTELEIAAANNKIEQFDRDIQIYQNRIYNLERQLILVRTQE